MSACQIWVWLLNFHQEKIQLLDMLGLQVSHLTPVIPEDKVALISLLRYTFDINFKILRSLVLGFVHSQTWVNAHLPT